MFNTIFMHLSSAAHSAYAGVLEGLPRARAAETVAGKKKIESLQSLRLLASLGVLQYHLWANYLYIHFGHPGTDFFLVLIGTVAALSQAKAIPQGGWGKYMFSRIARLYVMYIPLFLVTLLVKWEDVTLDWALRSFFFAPIPDRLPLIGCTWMLTYFMLFYLVFSLAFLARRESVLLVLFSAWAVAIAARCWLGWKPGLPQHWEAVLFSERNLDMLVGYLAGFVLRKRWVTLTWGRALFWVGLAGMLGGTLLLNTAFSDLYRSLYLGIPVALFVLGAGVLERSSAPGGVVRALSHPWLVWLGGTSYVLYLSHPLFLQAWSRLLPVTPWLVPLITLGAVTAAAFLTLFWEEPILRLLKTRRWLSRR